MRTLLTIVAIAAVGLCLGAAVSPVAAAFGNTIVSTYPDGRTAELWVKPDGTYTAEGRRHDPSRGRWRVKGNRLCLSQVRPMPSPFSYCTAIPASGMDRAWPAKAVSGERITVKLVPGHHAGEQSGA